MSTRTLLLAAICMNATPAAAQDVMGGRAVQGLVYDRVGSGAPIVFIHGAFLDRRQWDREFDRLYRDFTLVRYDQRGHGDSELPEETFSPVDDLFALLDELRIARATLVGLSNGAQVAIDAALARPDRVERLVLAAPAISGYAPKERPAFAADLAAALKDRDYHRATDVLLATPIYATPPGQHDLVRTMLTGNERLWALDPRIVRQPERPAIDRLQEIKVPVLILVGDNDVSDIREQAQILNRRVAGARLMSVAGGGHLLNLTSPEPFERAIRDFVPARGASSASLEAAAAGERQPSVRFKPGDGVSTPVVLSEVKPTYTADAMRAGIEGSVTLECVVQPDGTVAEPRVLQGIHPGLDQEALKALLQWRFVPGMRDGRPVPVVVKVEMTFRIKR